MGLKNIHPDQFHYNLPKERIADFPLDDRSASKLLVYDQGKIKHKMF